MKEDEQKKPDAKEPGALQVAREVKELMKDFYKN